MIELEFSHLALPCKDGFTVVVANTRPTQSCLQGTRGFGRSLLQIGDMRAYPKFMVARGHHLAVRTKFRMAGSTGIGCSADIATCQDGETV